MSPKGGDKRQMESVRLKINEQLASVGEEILFVVDKQQRGAADVCSVELSVRVFVLERLSAVGEFMVNLFQREMETLETLLETRNDTKLHTAGDASSMTVVEPQKRVRGRPRKYPVGLPSPALQSAVIQPERRKGGRPRLSECDGPVPSPLPEEEEERAGREEETRGEDEERTGRQHDGDPAWNLDASSMTIQHMVVEHQKRGRGRPRKVESQKLGRGRPRKVESQKLGRGRPRKYPVGLPNPALQSAVIQPKKRKEHHRGRSTVSRETASKRHSTLSEEQREMDQGRGLLDAGLKPVVELYRMAVGSEDDDRDTEPVAGTSTEHMQTQTDDEDCGTSQPTADDQLLSSHCSESDTEDIDEDWEDTREGHLALDTLQSQKTHNVEGQRLSLSKTLSQDLKSSKHSRTGKKISGKGSSQMCDVKQHTRTKRKQTPYTCEVCGKLCIHKGNLNTHMRSHTKERPFTCEVCGKCFSLKSNLNIHMITHTEKKSFSCISSGKGSSQKCDVKQHKRTRRKRTPCTCEVCGKIYSDKGNLNMHMRSHTGEKPFTCTVCCKGFSQKENLKVHIRTHTGDKPFVCTVCGKSFNNASHLKKHMRVHTEDKSLICEICGKGLKGNLESHMKMHTGEKPFSCTVCGKDFSLKSNLKIHMATHTGEKPYNCIVCDKGFSQKAYIKIHMRVHTGETPFTCTWCVKRFGRKCHLVKHMRRKHTGVKPT